MTEEQWNNPGVLATPGAQMSIKLYDGRIVEGTRPGYIDNATSDDPVFHDRCGNVIETSAVVGWTYQGWSHTQNGNRYDD